MMQLTVKKLKAIFKGGELLFVMCLVLVYFDMVITRTNIAFLRTMQCAVKEAVVHLLCNCLNYWLCPRCCDMEKVEQ